METPTPQIALSENAKIPMRRLMDLIIFINIPFSSKEISFRASEG
jgi:hypothetical protein